VDKVEKFNQRQKKTQEIGDKKTFDKVDQINYEQSDNIGEKS
jgi:hypothetical protein